jgi:hypothetical protein
MKKHVALMALAAAGALAFGGTYAQAANIGVAGTKLIVVDKLTASSSAKAVFVAKDAGITKGTGTDPLLIDASLDIGYDNGIDAPISGQFLAPSGAEWLVNKDTVAKRVNKTAPTGGGTKVTVIKPGKLAKLVGKNLGDTPLAIFTQQGAATGIAITAYCVNNDGDSTCHCTTFSSCAYKLIAGDTGAKLVCKGGTADALCSAITPPPPPPPFLSFTTGTPTGACGVVKTGGAGGTTLKALNCGGLNVGGGGSTVAEGPTPANAETQMNITGAGPVYPVTGRTAAESGSNNNCSNTGCAFGPYLPITNLGTSTCVRNTFAVPASGTLDSSTGTFDGGFPLTSSVFLTGNSTFPCPLCLGGTPGVTNSGTCQSGLQWAAGVGPSPDAGAACTPVNAAMDSHDCDPPAGSMLPSFSVNLTPITTGTASMVGPAGAFCPLQAAAGAFSCNGAATALCPGGAAGMADYIEENGVAAGPMGVGPEAATLASTFCIPSVGGALGFLINGAASLPGPGATSLPGTLEIVL